MMHVTLLGSLGLGETMRNRDAGWAVLRLLPLCVFLCSALLIDLSFTPILFTLSGPGDIAFACAMFGAVIGQLLFVAIFGGLWGKSWIDGFLMASLLLVIAATAIICSQPLQNYLAEFFPQLGFGVAFDLPSAFGITLLTPLFVVGVSAGLLGCRQFFGWRLFWGNRKLVHQETGSIEDLLTAVAVVASTLVLGQVAQKIFESDATQMWAPIAFLWPFFALIGGVLLVPATWSIFLARRRSQTVGGVLGLGTFAVVTAGVTAAIANASSTSSDAQEAVSGTIATASCASIVFCVGALSLRLSGFRIVRGTTREAPEAETSELIAVVPSATRLSLRLRAAIVLLFAIGCNVGVSQLQAWRERTDTTHAALREDLSERGGSMVTEYRKIIKLVLGAGATDETLAGFTTYQSIKSISLEGSRVTPGGLKLLQRFPRLTELNLNDVELDAEGWDEVRKLKQLESLSIANTGLSSDSLRQLHEFPAINSIDFGELGLTRNDLELMDFDGLAATRSFHRISLRGNRLTDSDLAEFLLPASFVDVSNMPIDGSGLEAMVRVHELDLSGTNVSNNSLLRLLSKVGAYSLKLRDTQVDDAAVKQLLTCGLGEIDISGSAFTEAGLAKLVRGGIPSVTASSEQFDGSGLKNCRGCVLQELDLSNSGITDETISSITALKQISRLNIAETRITDDGLRHLQGTLILGIDIRKTSITAEGLKRALQGTQLITIERGRFTDDEMQMLETSTSLQFTYDDEQ